MPDFIRLLPDSVANQIAAGEVIQRPASAIKELLENAIDAGASVIKLIVKDAGRTMIQVIDNGSGMSMTDARMCFERHATSKIREAQDLFSIRTLGFRGEALASIAAIAQVELRTRKQEEELGTSIIIEGSRFKSQEEISCSKGTSMIVRNLFFNVPARRNFLKSDAVEFRHIVEEFQRVAMVHPDIEFSLTHNDKMVFSLGKTNLKQRIVHIFGNHINDKLLNVELRTEHLNIYGYAGKPEAARKTRGEQYFFANGRFIRHSYLHHAVEQAYEALIPDSSIPVYFLFIEVDPSHIDVNIHPTKTEVNFQFGQLIYASMRSAVKQSLGMYSLSPTLDFDSEHSFDQPMPKGYEPKPPSIRINPDYNPFGSKPPVRNDLKPNREQWEKHYEILVPKPAQDDRIVQAPLIDEPVMQTALQEESKGSIRLIQVQNRYIVTNVKSGMLIVDQQKAHERILFEQILKTLEHEPGTQQLNLFPVTIHLSLLDSDILIELRPELNRLGFDINELGGGTFVINAIPAAFEVGDIEQFIEGLLEDFKKNKADPGSENRIRLARLMCRNLSVKSGKTLQTEEMQDLIDQLFACQVPEHAPDGSPILKILNYNEIAKLIG